MGSVLSLGNGLPELRHGEAGSQAAGWDLPGGIRRSMATHRKTGGNRQMVWWRNVATGWETGQTGASATSCPACGGSPVEHRSGRDLHEPRICRQQGAGPQRLDCQVWCTIAFGVPRASLKGCPQGRRFRPDGANGIKLSEEAEGRKRPLFWSMLAIILIGLVGCSVMVLHRLIPTARSGRSFSA